MPDLFKETIPSILQTKKPVITTENEKDYVPFVVNKALSFHYDCILYANEMNRLPNVDGLLQYQYLLNTIRPYKRPFQKWLKRETVDDLEVVKEYYNYSNERAKEALPLLSKSQLDVMRKELDKGGLHARNKRTDRGDPT
jgi:hypothetical protein